ncbi:MAG: ABC transporter permease, partial [Bauldia sp.]
MTDLAHTKSPAGGETDWRHPHDHPIRRFVISNRAALGSLAVFVAMLLVFFIANPRVFSTWNLYTSLMTTLPVALFLTAPQVFEVTAGEIDLSFPAVMGLSALAFAVVVQAGYDPFLAIAVALVAGSALGFGVGALVVYGGLSSLVATLGMN